MHIHILIQHKLLLLSFRYVFFVLFIYIYNNNMKQLYYIVYLFYCCLWEWLNFPGREEEILHNWLSRVCCAAN